MSTQPAKFRKPGKTTIRHLDITVGADQIRVSLKRFKKTGELFCVEVTPLGANPIPAGQGISRDLADAAYASACQAWSHKAHAAGTPVEYPREKTGRMIPCTGEAHSNPYIDHCMVCLPRWGEVEEIVPIDLARAEANLWDIPCPSMSRELFVEARKLEKAGKLKMVSVNKGNSYYSAMRWVV